MPFFKMPTFVATLACITLSAGAAINVTSPTTHLNRRFTIEDIPAFTGGDVTREVIALGSFDGDLDKAFATLKLAGIINENGDWEPRSKDFTVVQTGNMCKGALDCTTIYNFMAKLRSFKDPDRIITLYGDEELRALQDPVQLRRIQAAESQYNDALETHGEIRYDVARYLPDYMLTARVPLHSFLGPVNAEFNPKTADAAFGPIKASALGFVHGAFDTAWSMASIVNYPTGLNNFAENDVREMVDHGTLGYTFSKKSPAYLKVPKNAQRMEYFCEDTAELQEKYGVSHFIVGANYGRSEITSLCKGTYFMIDTTVPSALKFSYTWSYLDKEDGRFYFWEDLVINALYEGKTTQLGHSREMRELIFN